VTPGPTPFAPSSGPVDARYGIISTDSIDLVSSLGVKKYLDFSYGLGNVPSGSEKVLFIRSVATVPNAAINAAAASAPGSTWYVLGEPNVSGVYAGDVVVGLHDIYVAIKAADPTAKITSPSILNFDFTCIQCGGYDTGHSFVDSFISEYFSLYGENPPVDYWAIDAYPIVWAQNQLPSTRSDIVLEQVADFRAYLDAIPSESGKPIIVTEVGLHWGYTGITWGHFNCNLAFPTGEYQIEAVKQYLREVFNGFESMADNGDILNWYLFSTYRDLTGCHPDSGYGLTLFDSPNAGAALSLVGQFYYNWIRGERN